MAECCSTPYSLLGLVFTVSFVALGVLSLCKFYLQGYRAFMNDNAMHRWGTASPNMLTVLHFKTTFCRDLYIDKSVFSSGFQGHDGGYHSADLSCSDWAHWAAGHSQSFPPQHHPLRRGGFHPAVHAGDCWPHSSGSGGLQRQVRASKQLAYAWSEYSFPATFRQDTWTLFTRGFIFETGFFSGSFLTFSEWLEHFILFCIILISFRNWTSFQKSILTVW